MPQENRKPARSWQQIAGEMTGERDGDKLLQLAKELDQVMEKEEREKARKKAGCEQTRSDGGAARL